MFSFWLHVIQKIVITHHSIPSFFVFLRMQHFWAYLSWRACRKVSARATKIVFLNQFFDAPPNSSTDILLTENDLPLTGGIRINGNNLHCAIRLDVVIKLHDLDRKHNDEVIYHNSITPSVGSSIHCYHIRKKGGTKVQCHMKSGWHLVELFVESLDAVVWVSGIAPWRKLQ